MSYSFSEVLIPSKQPKLATEVKEPLQSVNKQVADSPANVNDMSMRDLLLIKFVCTKMMMNAVRNSIYYLLYPS